MKKTVRHRGAGLTKRGSADIDQPTIQGNIEEIAVVFGVFGITESDRSEHFLVPKRQKLKLNDRVRKGLTSYKLLHLNEKNMDILEVYSVAYEQNLYDRASAGSYQQFRSVIGQILRLAVMSGRANVSWLCKPGATFQAICDIDLVKAFFNFFDIHVNTSTVMTEFLHIKNASSC